MVIDTVGLLAYESETKIILLQSIGDGEIDGIFEIPRACVKSIKTLATLPIDLEE
jgi:hypothetical protein